MQTCEECLEQIHPQALRCKWCRAKTPYKKIMDKQLYSKPSPPPTRNEKIFRILVLVFIIICITTCSLALMGYQ